MQNNADTKGKALEIDSVEYEVPIVQGEDGSNHEPAENGLTDSSTTTPRQSPMTIPLKMLPQKEETTDETQSSASLPSNLGTMEQLDLLPVEFRSDDKIRPIRYEDENGFVYKYSLQPMFYSVIFILLVELLERFCFYGIQYTQTLYLTGVYDDDWNANMSSIHASSMVSVSTAVAYSAPFVGALLSDSLLGAYWTIIIGCLGLYIPGLLLIAYSTIHIGEHFNKRALYVGLLGLWPVGTGMVKSVVNVFGAKQHHPILQSSLIESYYVNFYMCINIGALAGGIVIPILAQSNITLAYFLPVVMLGCGVLLFVAGTHRYVNAKPTGQLIKEWIKGSDTDSSDGGSNLAVIARISMLVVPFNIAYSQMATTFIVQGTVMQKAFGWIDAASMNNCDAISVLLFGYLIGNKVYPALAARDIKIPTTYKFAFGSLLSAIAIGCALIVEYKIHSTYDTSQEKLCVLWQAFAYMLIGAGEIFAVSAAYEVAFSVAPAHKKALASAVNLFFIGGAPNVLCIFLYNACRKWFQNSRGDMNIHRLEHYTEAKVANYFWLLFFIALSGVVINLHPSIRDWVASIEDRAAEVVRTPNLRKQKLQDLKKKRKEAPTADLESDAESAPLLRAKKYQEYLEYGSGPVLYKNASMRAGAVSDRSVSDRRLPHVHVKRSSSGHLLFRQDRSVLIKPGSAAASSEF